MLFGEPQTRILAVSSNLEFYLPGAWTLSPGGSYGQDETLYQTRVYTLQGASLRFSRGCYCNASVSAEIGAEGPLFTLRSEEHTSALQSLMHNSYVVFC